MLVDIEKIVVSDRIRKDFGNIEELANDIQENGLINPPVVTPELQLIAGERRLRACKLLGMNAITVNVMTVRNYEHQLRLEISENENRKEFTFSERVNWARRLEQIEALKAKERIEDPVQNFAEGETGRTRDKVANATGFGSGETYRKAKFIADNASPETIQRLDTGETSIHKEYERLKSQLNQTNQELERVKQERDRALKQASEVRIETKTVEVVPEDYEMAKQKAQELDMQASKLKQELAALKQAGRAEDQQRIQRLEADIKGLQQRPPETIEVVPEKIKRQIQEDQEKINILRRALQAEKEKVQAFELQNTEGFNEKEAESKRRRLQLEAEINSLSLAVEVKSFLQRNAMTSLARGSIASLSPNEKRRIAEAVNMLEEFTKDIKEALESEMVLQM